MAIETDMLEFKLVRKSGEVVLALEPLQGLWTAEQYLRLTDQTNQLIEFTDGTIEVLPMPTRKHQVILAFLYEMFLLFIRPCGGKVLFAPLRLHIRPDRFREPDLLLLRNINDPRNQEAFWLGADLVVEIVSPDNPTRDTVEKRTEYAEAGIPEYWIVDPQIETITVLRLEAGSYTEHGVFRRGTTATSALLIGFEVGVDPVFDAE
jgi:Uma2 family endonuclease